MEVKDRFIYKIGSIYRKWKQQRKQISKLKHHILARVQEPQNEGQHYEDYVSMQKKYYEDTTVLPENIVGQYAWHEQFPYETFLLYRYGDVRFPIFESYEGKQALDFGCGPGRMVKRMQKIFNHIDGCDISQRLLNLAKELNPESNFYHTNGNDLGNAPENFYDFIYCTISMQHIASHTIRTAILKNIKKCLKKGGSMTLQMAYNKDFPYIKNKEYFINNKKIVVKERGQQASYFSDDYHANGTNGAHDIGIGKDDLKDVKADFSQFFNDVAIWFANVSHYYDDLKGHKHSPYWAEDWIFIYGTKR